MKRNDKNLMNKFINKNIELKQKTVETQYNNY